MYAWIYLRHYQNLRVLASMLPLPSPFPDNITEHMHSLFGHIAANYHSITAPLVPHFTAFGSKIAVLSPLVAQYALKAYNSFESPLSGVSKFESIGPYQVNWETQQYKCWISHWITFSLLAALQALNIFWLFFIVRIAYRVVTSLAEEIRDDRSDYSTDEDEDRDAELTALRREQDGKAKGNSANGKSK
jgi:hypothetical protein